MEQISYVLLSFFFFTATHSTLVPASISHFLTAATKFSCCCSNKKNVSLLSLAIAVCRSFSR